MDGAILSASAALIGSLVGGASTVAGSWFAQRSQLRAHDLANEAAKREALYAEFIIEASKCLTEAWSNHAEGPEVVAGLYSAVHRMRLISSPGVIRIAEQVFRRVIEAYAEPDRTFDELRQRIASVADDDPLRDFSEACTAELRALRS
jgi:hypothetical protein